MALRLPRVTDDEWRRLAAARRTRDLSGPPARASIGAIEMEVRSLDRPQPPAAASDAHREAAAG